MNLYICEKPSLAKALFVALGGSENEIKQQQRNGYFQHGDETVTFCFGHMLELLDPEDHDIKYKEWKLDTLPFRFEPKLKIKKDSAAQYKVISQLLKKANIVFHVGDPDEEGQLLIDEILTYEKSNKPVKRILIADLNKEAIKKSLAKIDDNCNHVKHGEYALARSISDQLFGYNLTRAYTLAARLKGHDGVFNIGRVQTAIVNLIDERCQSVESHKESYYHNVDGLFEIGGTSFPARYITTENDPVNDKGQIIDKAFAATIANKVKNQPSLITQAKHSMKKKRSPMPYTMATLQSDCARKFGLTALETLDTVQSLYEKHKVLTYPRSNCSYLGDDHFNERHDVLKAISTTVPMFAKFIDSANATEIHTCFNSDKVGAHHGIIPTYTRANFDDFTDLEKKIYQLVARSYLALFYPPADYAVSDVEVNVADLHFSVRSETNRNKGWMTLYTNDQDNPDIEEASEFDSNLAALNVNQSGLCVDASVNDKTAPKPKYYVESTLLRDLTHIAKHIESPELKKIMDTFFKEKGIHAELGTEATRASVIEKVFESGMAVKEKLPGYKELAFKTSDIGKQFIRLLPNGCKKVDVTADWCRMGVEVKNGKMSVEQYVDAVYQFIEKQVNHVKSHGLDIKVDLESCSECFDGYLKLIKTTKSKFFGCTNHPNCSVTYPEYKGSPYTQKHDCPECGKPLVLRSSGNDYFFGCSGYNDGCKNTMACVGGKPATKSFNSSKRSSGHKAKKTAKGSRVRTGSVLKR